MLGVIQPAPSETLHYTWRVYILHNVTSPAHQLSQGLTSHTWDIYDTDVNSQGEKEALIAQGQLQVDIHRFSCASVVKPRQVSFSSHSLHPSSVNHCLLQIRFVADIRWETVRRSITRHTHHSLTPIVWTLRGNQLFFEDCSVGITDRMSVLIHLNKNLMSTVTRSNHTKPTWVICSRQPQLLSTLHLGWRISRALWRIVHN